ncbi:MAG: NADH-quinone oxidoreductase subunit H [Deltaproteobacteria bacterium]|nr:NADH-quinone oxidoreductase subunit H [Deltaproteobacteria bacterium]
MTIASFLNILLGLLLAPLLLGIVNRTKAVFAGRTGQPLLQAYYDIVKQLRKGAVYSNTASWVFRAGPIVGFAAVLTALCIVPLGGVAAPLAFSGDLLLFAYLLGAMRFFTVIAALDTGSSFEGMGASREVLYSALAEPALLIGLAAVARETGSLSLSTLLPAAHVFSPEVVLVVVALLVVYLCENARIPFDDPNTHLELTMIHEVMVLDHSGPDFAFILYGAALKLWVLGLLIVGIVFPAPADLFRPLSVGTAVAGLLGLAVVVGVIESTMARLRLIRIPQLLVAAGSLSAFAFLLVLRS